MFATKQLLSCEIIGFEKHERICRTHRKRNAIGKGIQPDISKIFFKSIAKLIFRCIFAIRIPDRRILRGIGPLKKCRLLGIGFCILEDSLQLAMGFQQVFERFLVGNAFLGWFWLTNDDSVPKYCVQIA